MPGLRGILRFPLSSVAACWAWPGARSDLDIDVRWGGTGIPGRLTAGTMLGPEGRSFWLYGSGENAVYIALRDQAFAYVVIEVDDPAAFVTWIDFARRR